MMIMMLRLKGGAPTDPLVTRVLCHPDTFLYNTCLLYVAKLAWSVSNQRF